MGVAYYLLDTEGKKRFVGAHALGQGYKRCECWHSDEINSKMIHFLNKKYGGQWKLVSEDSDEAEEAEDSLKTNLAFRKDVRTYACEIDLTSWNELRMKDIGDREAYEHSKREHSKRSKRAFNRRYIKPIDKEEEERLIIKYTAFPLEKMKMKLRQEFCQICIFNAMKTLEYTDKTDFIVRLVKRINEMLAPIIPKRKKVQKKRKVDETDIKKELKKEKKAKKEKWDKWPRYGSIVTISDGSTLMVVDRDSKDPSKYTLEKLYLNKSTNKWCVLLPKERFTRMYNLYVQEEFGAVYDSKEKRILKDLNM